MTSSSNTLKPATLDIDPNGDSATELWKHWKKTFDNFIDQLEEERTEGSQELNKLCLLTNLTSADLFEFVEGCTNFDAAINTFEGFFVKTHSELFARHLLATRRQQPGETLNELFQELQIMTRNYQGRFISGLTSAAIHERLLENKTLDLQSAFDQATALDISQPRACTQHRSVCHGGCR